LSNLRCNVDIKDSNIYAYYVKNHHAIKVGYGDSSIGRLYEYSRQYSLISDIDSLKTWNIPISGLAPTIEKTCHQTLILNGYSKIELASQDHTSQEIFYLGDSTYEDTIILVASAIDEAMFAIVKKLGNEHKFRENNERALLKKQEILAKKKLNFDSEVNECTNYIKSTYDWAFRPYAEIMQEAQLVWREFEWNQTGLRFLFQEKKDPIYRFRKWEKYPKIRSFVEPIFRKGRVAKVEYVKCLLRYQNYKVIEAAEKNLNLSLYRPNGFDLILIDYDFDNPNWALLEIRLAVQNATGFGGDEALQIIKQDSFLLKLVEIAGQQKPAELSSEFLKYRYPDYK
jgi:hypothetical protein